MNVYWHTILTDDNEAQLIQSAEWLKHDCLPMINRNEIPTHANRLRWKEKEWMSADHPRSYWVTGNDVCHIFNKYMKWNFLRWQWWHTFKFGNIMHVNIRLSNVSLHLIVNLQGLSDQNKEMNVANFPTHLEAWKPNMWMCMISWYLQVFHERGTLDRNRHRW